MRKTFIALAAALSLGPLTTQAGELDPAKVHQLCTSASTMAKSVFDARYRGASLSEAMDLIEPGEILSPYLRSVVAFVYDRPKYTTAEYRQESRQETADDVYLVCYQGFGG